MGKSSKYIKVDDCASARIIEAQQETAQFMISALQGLVVTGLNYIEKQNKQASQENKIRELEDKIERIQQQRIEELERRIARECEPVQNIRKLSPEALAAKSRFAKFRQTQDWSRARKKASRTR